MPRTILPILLALILAGCASAPTPPKGHVPDWAKDAVFYQIFPERFRNGDPSNDPTRASLEYGNHTPADWQVTPWTADWYAKAPWEKEMGADFYQSDAARQSGGGEGKDIIVNRRYGGDLQGVIDELDYLKTLGINTIYFNPLFWARSMHKYDGNSYHHIDPYFGPDPRGDFALMATETSDPATWKWTSADKLFLKLLQEAHTRDIRIIIDGVFNHTGRDFFAFVDLEKNQQQSPYKDWYIVEQFDDPATPENEFKYKGWWGVATLPEFADTPDGTDQAAGPKQYIFDATKRWMDPNGDGNPVDGVDGWRLDVVPDVPMGFWVDWNAYVRTLNPEVYTTSEVWQDASKYIEEGGFDATMNYYGFAFPVKGFLVDNSTEPSEFA
ncbi:MAG TPA: alpha-amylase family glycosyl hydrolase, partial [Rhodothermales bacterium]|nr:alpha-amylase family glycosyl hydrolase [Rhodothermales bacterium]